jgi:hypothetical protein
MRLDYFALSQSKSGSIMKEHVAKKPQMGTTHLTICGKAGMAQHWSEA